MKNSGNRFTSKTTFVVQVACILAVIVLVIFGTIGCQQLKPAVASSPVAAYPTEITVAQAAEKRDQGAFILDVRQQEEWNQFHIPGATLIPLGELPNRLNEVPKDREIIVVCRTGSRSARGRDTLRDAGFIQATSMAGGVTQWQAAGLPIATGQ
jgi:rhodanese-related sulfurtransferase